jgi:hypothetical protein
MLIIAIISLMALSVVGNMCINYHEENKRLKKRIKHRAELDRKSAEELHESIRLSCEQVEKKLLEWEKKCTV